MLIKELFPKGKSVTRDIPPVIYFHEQSPEKLQDEVSEYIITGGFPKSHPNHRRVPKGIHEQYVKLMRSMARALDRDGGPELPASWISGFYGSGKSIFAKLLGLGLDGVELPDGMALSEALLRRDTSPLTKELREAWDALVARIDPIACVFDIGGFARDNEHIHTAVVRGVQQRLNYCREPLVAEFELRLEREKQYERFLDVAGDALDRPWEDARQASFADDDFSLVMHRMRPELFTEPTTWIDTKGGSADRAMSPDEATRMLADMLHYRAPGKTLFVVVDEVSQYIHQDSQRMLKLQSFVSSLGQRLRGRIWLLVTGQERLEEESDKTVIGKMKDRFPEQLRVHLATTNIRDVVHRRLLEKDPHKEQVLRDLYRQHRATLHNYAYEGHSITEDDFVEVYPMLPGHVDLLMRITSALRLRSTRSQGDEHAIRGLLQLLGELFRTQKLAEEEVGALVTLDAIYEVQQTALDSDIQTTLHRLLEHCAEQNDALAARAAKTVALLELIQENTPTTAELVAACLYDRVDRGNQIDAVRDALERLRQENLLGYSEKHGYKVQSSAGQEWDRERRDIGVTPEQQSERIQLKLKYLLGTPKLPELQSVPFPWSALYSDNRQASEKPLVRQRSGANAPVEFQFLPASETQSARWVQRSDEETQKDRLIWVVGEAAQALAVARDLDKSQRMVDRYKPRRESLTREKQRLLLEEEARAEDLEQKLEEVVARAWMQGRFYFRGREMNPGDQGGSFAAALTNAAKGADRN